MLCGLGVLVAVGTTAVARWGVADAATGVVVGVTLAEGASASLHPAMSNATGRKASETSNGSPRPGCDEPQQGDGVWLSREAAIVFRR